MSDKEESPAIVYGRLLESMTIGDGIAKRSKAQFAWLIEGDRYKDKELGFKNASAFVRSLAPIFSELKLSGEDQKELIEQANGIGASQRATADMLGVGVGTVNRELNSDSVPVGTSEPSSNNGNQDATSDTVPSGTPRQQELTEAARKREAEWASTTLLHDTLAYLNPKTLEPEEWARRAIDSINLAAWPSRRLAEPTLDCLQKCEAALSALVRQWREQNVKDRKD